MMKQLLQTARDLLGRRPDPAIKAVKHDRFDQTLFNEAIEDAPALQELIDTVTERHGYAGELLQDTFNLFWQGDPRLQDAGDMHPKCAANHAAINALKELPDVEAVRANSVGDKYAAILGALSVGSRLVELLDEQPEPDTDEQEQQLQEAMDQLEQATAAAESGDGDNQQLQEAIDQAQQAADQWQQVMAEAQEAAQAAAQRVTAVNYEMGKHTQSGPATAATQLAEGLGEEAEGVAAIGLEPGAVEKLSFRERERLARVLRSKEMEAFRKLVGRFRFRANSEQARKVDYGRDEVWNVTLTGDLPEVLGSEIAKMAHPTLHNEFMRRLMQKQLLSRHWRGKQKSGDGPMVVCVDESSSMKKAMRSVFSKAFVLTLMSVAFKSKRTFHAVSFSKVTKLWSLSPDRPMEVVDFIESQLNGGTDYVPPLMDARTLVEKDTELRRADIVFITDGEASPPATFVADYQEWRQSRDVRVWGIAIAHQPSAALSAVSDNVRSVYDFADVEQMTDLLRAV